MAAKQKDASEALVTVIKALEGLSDAERLWVLQSAATRWNTNFQGSGTTGLKADLTGPTSGLASPSADVQTAITNKDARAFTRRRTRSLRHLGKRSAIPTSQFWNFPISTVPNSMMQFACTYPALSVLFTKSETRGILHI